MKIIGLIVILVSVGVYAAPFDESELDEVIGTLKNKAYYSLSEGEIYEAAISGVLQAMEEKADPRHVSLVIEEQKANTLLEPRKSKEMKKELKGEVTGIGVTINFDRDKGHNYPVILNIIEGGGAASTGLKEGDQLLKVDGKPANQFRSFQDLVYAIRGPVGSKVNLMILRDGEVLSEMVSRTKLSFESVNLVEDYDHAVLVEVGSFNEKSPERIAEYIKLAKKENKPLILDLRMSSGGLFSEGLDAIKLFAKKGEEVLVTNGRDGKKKIEVATIDGPGLGLDLTILISSHTKSISEAFAASLRRLRGAFLIGSTTYGKGTVESVVSLKKGYSMKFTIGEMSLPGEETWNAQGIEPDIPVGKKNSKNDPALRVAEKILRL